MKTTPLPHRNRPRQWPLLLQRTKKCLLSPVAQTFVNLARERDRAELRQTYVKFPGPLGVELRQPNATALRAAEMEKLTDEEYAVRLGVSHL